MSPQPGKVHDKATQKRLDDIVSKPAERCPTLDAGAVTKT